MGPFIQDIRFALRSLRKSPGFTLLAVATLALGLGANTAIFSAVSGIVLDPLPFFESGRLVAFCETHASVAGYCIASPPDVDDWRRRSETFEDIGLARGWPFLLSTESAPDQGTDYVRGALATPAYFEVFRARPAVGRLFAADDDETAVVLDHGFWKSRFGGDGGIVGSAVLLDGEPHTVVGVLEAGVEFPHREGTLVWANLPGEFRSEENRDWRGFTAVGRLRAGVDLKQAQSEMTTIAERLAGQYPASNDGWGVALKPLATHVVGPVRSQLLVFLGAVALVLLIGCANVANLLLARAARRQRELAVRASLGAGRGRLVRQLIAESLVVAFLSGAAGLLIAIGALKLFLSLAPSSIPRLDAVSIDGGVLAFAFMAALLTSVLCGLVPALRASAVDLAASLKAGAAERLEGGRLGTRGALVVSEVALALMLLIGAGLLTRSFAEAASWEGGFDDDSLLTVWALSSESKYPEGRQVADLFSRAVEALEALPGVSSAGAASAGPLFGGREPGELAAPEQPDHPLVARWSDVDPGYFETLGIALRRGRPLSAADTTGSPRVALVNETLARRMWPGEDPIGRRISWVEEEITFEVVGVMNDVRPFSADGIPEPEIYWSNRQLPRWATYFVMRTETDPVALAELVRERLRELDPDLAVTRFSTFGDLLDRQLVRPRFNMTLLGIFALAALILAVGGTYAVLAYAVSRRTREIGLRMALGATRGDIVRLVVAQGARLAALGCAAGLAGAFFLTRALAGMLYGVTATDPMVFGGLAAVLVLVVVAACWVPARRAASIEAIDAIRAE